MAKQFEPFHNTDLLIGVASPIPNEPTKHFFLCDWDEKTPEEIMGLIGKVLFNKYRFGDCYLIQSGKGYHLINFTEKLSIRKYVKILDEIKADPKFVEWVERVSYGVLRLSRRSSHQKVPHLVAILKSPYRKTEDIFARNYYFNLLSLESKITHIQRVNVSNVGESDDKKG